MKAIEQCYTEVITLTSGGATIRVGAYRYQDFAVHSTKTGQWLLAHLPSGLSISGWSFKNKDQAAEAMLEIALLRNRWTDIPPGEIEKLKTAVDAICERLGAIKQERQGTPLPKNSLNGYIEPTFDKES